MSCAHIDVADQRDEAPNGRPITMRDIAIHCGVSIWTVSLALRHDPRVAERTTALVLAAAAELGYDPAVHQAARRLVSRRLGTEVANNVIGLLLPPHFQAANYYAYTSLGVLDQLASEGYGVINSYLPIEQSETMPRMPSIYSRGEVDGAIGGGYLFNEQAMQLLRGNPGFGTRPVVSLLMRVQGCSVILANDRQGGYLATRHLLEIGHRHILHYYLPTWAPMLAERLAGACQAMREAGLDPERYLHMADEYFFGFLVPPQHLRLPDLSSDSDEDKAIRKSLDLLVARLREHPEITAILAPNDPTARRLWYTLPYYGIRVPEDLSLIGFDDTDGVPDMCGRNLLTTVRLPLEQVGQEAARLMIHHLASKSKTPEEIVLPTELVVRSSTAPPRTEALAASAFCSARAVRV